VSAHTGLNKSDQAALFVCRRFLKFVNKILLKYILIKMIGDLEKAISLIYTEGKA